MDTYNVTPLTFGSSNDSTTKVSLKTKPEPEIRANVRDSAAVACGGEVVVVIRAADAAVRKDVRAERRELMADDESILEPMFMSLLANSLVSTMLRRNEVAAGAKAHALPSADR